MCRKMFAAVAALAALSPLRAQQVPGRDLFRLPLGTMAEPQALAAAAGGGFLNPATLALPNSDVWRFSASAYSAPDEQGVASQLGTASFRMRSGVTAGISLAQSGIGDLPRTDTDPQSIPGDIPYHSVIGSAIVAGRRGPATVGAAVRYRSGKVDDVSGGATSLDVGVVVERPLGLPLRAAASSFLLAPSRAREKATAFAAVEGYLPWTTNDLRAGVSFQLDEGGGDERFVYASGRAGILDLRGGIASQQTYGYSITRLRVGIGLHYAHYVVGLAREDGTSGLGASYQFLLTLAVPRTQQAIR